jgi:hypothetical protein
MLKDCLVKMSRLLMATQTPVGVKLGEKGAAAALKAIFIKPFCSPLAGPLALVQQLGFWI